MRPLDVPTTVQASLDPVSAKLRALGLGAVYLASLAQLGRALVIVDDRAPWVLYVVLGAAYLIVYTAVTVWPARRPWLLHAAMAAECVLVLMLLSLEPELDFMTGMLVGIAFQAALFFAGRTTWLWVVILAVLTSGSLMLYLGPLRGLSLGLVSMAIEFVLASYVVVARELETARRQSQVMVQELETRHRQLQDYAAQAGELATVDERDRVARDLNDSVAHTIAGILAATRTARAVLAEDASPGADDAGAGMGGGDVAGVGASVGAAAPQLAALQAQTQQALAQMRGLIAELRPKSE